MQQQSQQRAMQPQQQSQQQLLQPQQQQVIQQPEMKMAQLTKTDKLKSKKQEVVIAEPVPEEPIETQLNIPIGQKPELADYIRRWIQIDDEIGKLDEQKTQINMVRKTIQTQKKDLLNRRSRLQGPIFKYMDESGISDFAIGDKGTMKSSVHNPLMSLSQKVIKQRIEEFFQNQPDIIEPLFKYIIDPTARRMEEIETLKLQKPRKVKST
jgi:hypothetical protein